MCSAPHWKWVLISFFTFVVGRTCPKLSPIICSLCAMQIKWHSCKMALGDWFHSPILWNDQEYRSKYRQQEDFPSKQKNSLKLIWELQLLTLLKTISISPDNGHWEELVPSLVASTFALITWLPIKLQPISAYDALSLRVKNVSPQNG